MFSRTEVVSTDDDPLTLSLEFAWKAKSTYWAGEIKVIDLYIDGQLRYSIDIPQGDDRETQAISLPLKPNTRPLGFRLPQSDSETNYLISKSIEEREFTSGPKINYLIIKDLDIARKIILRAGIFNEKRGNTATINLDGSLSWDTYFTREDVSLDLNVSSLKFGSHYKVIVTHDMRRRSPGSPFWQGKDLDTIIEENGPSKKVPPPRTHATSFFNSNLPSETHRREILPPQLEFENRKEHSEKPQEIAFFTLALEKKYEEAIMYASNMDDQGLGGRFILDLLKYREELGIDVNTMNDNHLKQTPLHRVAINKKWHAYYALAERGGNSYLLDNSGISAQDYRRRNGMTIFNQQAQQQILRDLFGDAAPVAKAFINEVNNCCIG